jgi:hypothetical protein
MSLVIRLAESVPGHTDNLMLLVLARVVLVVQYVASTHFGHEMPCRIAATQILYRENQ